MFTLCTGGKKKPLKQPKKAASDFDDVSAIRLDSANTELR